MANDIRVNIEVRKEQEAKAKLKAVGDQAEKTGDQIEELGDQATVAGKATEKAGDDFKAGAEGAGFLDKQIIQTTAHLKDLVTQLDRTGDTSLLKDIRKERRNLRQFQNLAKEIAEPVAEAGVTAGTGLAKSLAEGFRIGSGALKGAATPALIAVAATAVPGITTLFASAVLGGIGTGGIIGGIALASQDPRVQAVAQQVGDTLTEEFQDAASGFVDPLMRNLQKVAEAGWADRLAPSFDKLAEKVDPLTDGLLGLIDQALPGLQAAIDAAGPTLDVLADGLPEIGDALGDLFTAIASNPEAAAHAMELFIDATTDALELIGTFIAMMMVVYEGAYDVAEALGIVEEETVILGKKIGQQGAAKDVKDFGRSAFDAEKQLEDFNNAISKVFGQTIGVREATLNYEQALDDMVEQLTSGKRTLDEHTQAGRDNWNSINNLSEAIEEQRQANVRNGMGMDEANAKYDRQLEDLRETLLALGYNKKAVNDYINELKGVPKEALTEIHLKGIKSAIGDLRELAGILGAVAGYGIINVAASLGKRAMGGPVSAGGTYIVGENGPELLRMGASGGHVYNAGQTAGMLSGTSGGSAGGGGMTFAATVREPDSALGKALAAFVVPYIQIEVMNQGGDVVAVLGAPTR
jgi:tetratricopeptide (TPR) repeat protein